MNGQIREQSLPVVILWSRITHNVISLNNIIKKTDHKSINKLTYGQFCCILVL